jgi:hypothetical protein
MKKIETKKIGVIGVDAGLCWIGDPCYVIHTSDGKLPPSMGKNWDEFCSKLGDQFTTFGFNEMTDGLGIAVSTGYGDGVYPVYAKISDEGEWGKRVKEITIKFF